MQNSKKIFIAIVTILLAGAVLGSVIYFFNQAKKQSTSQKTQTELQADLAIARKNLAIETKRLAELRNNSYFHKISEEEYLKTKKLVEQTDIFFKDANSDQPKILLQTKNKIIETEINNKRAQINKFMKIWADNNAHSLETDKKLIAEIKTYLLVIQSYINQLQDIVSDLSINNSALSASQINSYGALIQNSSRELANIISTINQTEIIINNNGQASTTDSGSGEIEDQIVIITDIEDEIDNLEDEIDNTQATSTATTTATTTDAIATTTATSTDEDNNTDDEDTDNDNNNYYDSMIIYEPNPTPFQDNGVDIYNTNTPVPLQDW